MGILTVRERMEAYGIYENGVQNIEKEETIEDLREQIVKGAIEGDEKSYAAYGRVEKKIADTRYLQAKAEMVDIIKEFNELMKKDVRKCAEESYENQECRVWIENDSLYLRYNKIQNLLESLRC